MQKKVNIYTSLATCLITFYLIFIPFDFPNNAEWWAILTYVVRMGIAMTTWMILLFLTATIFGLFSVRFEKHVRKSLKINALVFIITGFIGFIRAYFILSL